MKLSVKEVLLTSRPFWWITTSAPFVAGYLIGDRSLTWPLVIGALYFVFPYNLFMYGINDIFDYESDIRNPRKAGIEGAVLAKAKHMPLAMVIGLVNLPFLAYLLVVGNVFSSIWLGLIVFMALAYSVKNLRFKEVPLLDSFTSAFHYTSPFVLGVLLSGADLPLGVYAAFYLWAMSNHAFGAIQDIKPDRAAGIKSVATQLGSATVVYGCLTAYAVAALLPAILFGKAGLIPSLLLLTYVLLTVRTWNYRHQPHNPIFHRQWQIFTYMNYMIGGLMTAYLCVIAFT